MARLAARRHAVCDHGARVGVEDPPATRHRAPVGGVCTASTYHLWVWDLHMGSASLAHVRRFAEQDIIQKIQQLRIAITALTVHVPEVPYIVKLFQSFGFKAASAVFQARGRRHVRMALTPQDIAQGAHAIAAMHSSAPKFGTGTGVTDKPASAPRAGV